MAEEVATAPAPTPEPAPAPEAPQPSAGPTPDAPAATPEPQASAPSTEGKAEPEAKAPDWREVIRGVDPKELLSDPRIGGIVGSRLEAERRRAIQEAEARQNDERLKALRREDPEAYVKEVEAQEQQRAQAGQVVSGIHARVLNLVATLPDEVKAPLSGKNYPGTYDEGVFAYTRDLMEAYAAHREKTAVAKAEQRWDKEKREAIRKEILAEINGDEPSPDTTRGSAPANGYKVPATMAEIRRLPDAEYRKHMKEIEAAVLSGAVRK